MEGVFRADKQDAFRINSFLPDQDPVSVVVFIGVGLGFELPGCLLLKDLRDGVDEVTGQRPRARAVLPIVENGCRRLFHLDEHGEMAAVEEEITDRRIAAGQVRCGNMSFVLQDPKELIVEAEPKYPFVACQEVLPHLFHLLRSDPMLLAVGIHIAFLGHKAPENLQLALAVAEVDDVMGGDQAVSEQIVNDLATTLLGEEAFQLVRRLRIYPASTFLQPDPSFTKVDQVEFRE